MCNLIRLNDPLAYWLLLPGNPLFLSSKIDSPGILRIKEPNQRLSYDYNFEHIKTLNERLLKAGVRLAGVMNELFG